ncbi:MAG: hypothetical protein ABI867_44850 [Kofleriaceae bacterium]
MRQVFVLVLAMLAACEARVGVDTNNNVGGDDDDDIIDAEPGVTIDAPPDAPACFNGRVVFLSFEGEALTRAATSDARQNQASWMQIASGTAPRYRTNDGDRATQIQAIVDGVRTQLSDFPITVVTTRPVSGDYVMIVYGGTPQQVGSRFGGAVQELDCADTATRNDVAWIADNVGATQRIVNFSVGAIGFGLGLTATTVTTDCMCGWDNACQANNAVACTLTPGIARDPNANQRCAGVDAQDEVAVFRTAFCE